MAASERIFSLGPFVRLFLFVFEPLLDAVANLITSFSQGATCEFFTTVVFIFSGSLTAAWSRVPECLLFLLSLRPCHAQLPDSDSVFHPRFTSKFAQSGMLILQCWRLLRQ